MREVRAIATRGPGRPKGSKNTLNKGEVALVKKLTQVLSEHLHAEEDPLVQELIQMQIHIARGDPGYRGRYIQARAREIRSLLDRRLGKPTQRHEHTGEIGLRELLPHKKDTDGSS